MYVYIGEYYHVKGKNLDLYEIKIGTTKDLKKREYQLNDTKSPIGYRLILAWEVGEDYVKHERGIHAILDIFNVEGEWFEDTEGSIVKGVAKYMSIFNYSEVSLDSNKPILTSAPVLEKNDLLKYNCEQIENKLKLLNVEMDNILEIRDKNNKLYRINYNTVIENVRFVIGSRASGKVYVLAKGKAANNIFSNNPSFTKTATGWRLGSKGESYGESIDEILKDLDRFIEVIKK